MIQNKLINQFYLFKSPKNLSKNKKHVIFTSKDILNKYYKIKSKIRFKTSQRQNYHL